MTRIPWGAVVPGLIAGGLLWRMTRPPPPTRPAHLSETEATFRRASTKIVILGAGFAGLTTALTLDQLLGDRPETSILVVDRNNGSLYTPLLWTVAEGRSNGTDVVVPIRDFQRGRRFHVLQAEVTGIDLDNRRVLTDAGDRPYDHLVIALGSITQYPRLPGLQEHARSFRTPADALLLRDILVDAVETAHRSTVEAERQSWLTFVVSGGGDTGVELAGAINSYLAAGLLATYPWLTEGDLGPIGRAFRVVLVGRAPRLMPLASPREAEASRDALERAGVEVLTGTAVEGVREDGVETSAGFIPARTVFWAAGIGPSPILQELPVEHAKGGALVVDTCLRLPEHQEVYVVGDSAWANDVDGTPLPPTAQAAQIAATYAARCLAAQIMGAEAPEPFHYRPRGHLALLGTRTAVARIGPVVLTGYLAWWIWHLYYLHQLSSWKRRVALAFDWLSAAIFGRELAQLRMEPTHETPPQPRVEAGEVRPPSTT